MGNNAGMSKHLIKYINNLPASSRNIFASNCGTTLGYLRKAASTGQVLGAEICVAAELASKGEVTRKDIRPTDWHLIWPELLDKPQEVCHE